MNKGPSIWQALLAVGSKRSFQWTMLVVLFLYYPLIYYFGELVDLAHWEALRWKFFYVVHDVHRLFFLVPIIYAGYIFRVKGAVITTIAALVVFLPRALLLSPFPEPMSRMVVFTIFSGALGVLTAVVRNESERHRHQETLVKSQKDKLQGMLDAMGDGLLIIGPDYKVRYTNSTMAKEFGEGIGSPCYKYLQGFDSPCAKICKLPKVLNGKIERWEHKLPDGRIFEVLASPFVDSDEKVCQLAILRKRKA